MVPGDPILAVLQCQLGLRQGGETGRILEVEAGRRHPHQAIGAHARQGRLAALARPQQSDDRLNHEAGADLRQVALRLPPGRLGLYSRYFKNAVRLMRMPAAGRRADNCPSARAAELGARGRRAVYGRKSPTWRPSLRPSTWAKWASRLSRAVPCSRALAAIQRSLVGIGCPLRRRPAYTSA